jgi:4-nitrophenyl phosphatase
MVGLHREFDYERLRIAATAVRRGARFIATNSDATFPTPAGPIPGAGAIVAAIATVAGLSPVIAGKPHPPMAAAVGVLLDGMPPDRLLVVGDRLDTDGAFATTLGCPFALVRSGVTPPGMASDVPLAADEPDLAAVVELLLMADG